MKQTLVFIFVLISYTLTTQAQASTLQETQEDSVINVIAYFCKGDTMKYTYTDAVYKVTPKDTITSSYYTRDCMIVVTDSTSKGYNMEMTPLNIKLADDPSATTTRTKMNATIMRAFNNVKIKFHTDELGDIEAVDNWREVRDLCLQGIKLALDSIYQTDPKMDSIMPRKRFEGIIKLSLNNEEGVRKCIKELPLLFDYHGKQFKLGALAFTDSTSTMFPTKIRVLATYATDEDEDGSDGDYSISCSSTTAIPPKEAAELASNVFSNLLSGEMSDKFDTLVKDSLPQYIKNDSLKVEFLEDYYYFENGWPAHMRMMKSSGFPIQKKVEYKSIEWYYRSWKGYAMKGDDDDKKAL